MLGCLGLVESRELPVDAFEESRQESRRRMEEDIMIIYSHPRAKMSLAIMARPCCPCESGESLLASMPYC